jgi:RNA polymerase primary sigma factor
MVVRYYDLQNLSLGARPFHAILLCGEAAGASSLDFAAEDFLRTAEPPAHDRWMMTPDLKTRYATGGKAAIERMLATAKEQIRELVRPASRDLSDGPRSIKELFKLGTIVRDSIAEPMRVVIDNHRVDSHGRWDVTATLRLKPDKRGRSLTPVLVFASESGAGRSVSWLELQPLAKCSKDGTGRLVVAPGIREIKFRGISDATSHPVPASESTVILDIRDVIPVKEA